MANDQQTTRNFKATGVDKFHAAGYYGERVIAASGEKWDWKEGDGDGCYLNPFGYTGGTDHGGLTAGVFHGVAPKAKLVMVSSGGRFSSNSYKTDLMDKGFPYFEENGVTCMTTSLSVTHGSKPFYNDLDAWLEKLPNFVPCWCAGNDGEGKVCKIGREGYSPEVIVVGAAEQGSNGKWKTTGFSGSSDEQWVVDFCAPGYAFGSSGTSVATPYLCGMIALVNDFFIDKTGKPLTRKAMVQFLKDCCVDIEDEGPDFRSGYGMPCLPDPADIDVWKYQTKDEPEQPEPVDPEPGEPEEPTEPSKPEQPEEPTEPEQPVHPEEPSKPENPEKPSEPETPSEDPSDPSDDDPFGNINANEILGKFVDVNDIADWAREDVAACVYLDLLEGDGAYFNPKSYPTREELAAFGMRILKYILK